jgi:uncharacterized protein (TIGR02246 family)
MAALAEAQGDLEGVLLDRERQRREALVAEDMERFADLIADDIVHVHTTGVVQNKTELIDRATTFLKFYAIDRGPLNIRRLAPDVAVMTGPMTNTVGKRGEAERLEIQAFVTQVWVLRDGRWQIASFHAVRVPEAQERA